MPKEKSVRFVTFEGLDGAGKSTQIELLKDWLIQMGEDPICTREPGGSSIGPEIRKILLKSREEILDPMAEVMLLMADRIQHIRKKIIPAVAAGRLVICDRFFDSTLAYQGGGRRQELNWLERFFEGNGLAPHLTFYLSISPETALQRLQTRKLEKTPNRLDQESLSFFQRVKKAYESRIERHPEIFRVLDAEKTAEEIQKELRNLFRREVILVDKKT